MTLTSNQTESALQAAIIAAQPDSDNDNYIWVYDFSDSWVVYYSSGEYLQDDYSIDDDGTIALAGEPKAVRPVTTFVPTGRADSGARAFADPPREVRAFLASRGIPDLLGAGQVRDGSIRLSGEALTYSPSSPHSFFRDLISADRDRGATERLARHREETGRLRDARQRQAWQQLSAGNFEYRVEPNVTDGQGGYFSPPLWLNQLFATASRPARVLASLIPATFVLPDGVSQVNLPIIGQGTTVQPASALGAVAVQEVTDQAGSSTVVTFAGQSDVALQLLEQSPSGAHLDWAFFTDLTFAADADLETQLLVGLGSSYQQLAGIANVAGSVGVTYTDASPTGSKMWPFFGQAIARVGNNRALPPEAWLMRTARWGWLNAAEDTASRPFGLPTPFFMGDDDLTPNPVGGLLGFPVFLDDAIPANLGAAGTQDVVLAVRPSDLLLLESEPRFAVLREPLSGSLGVRLQMHSRAAAVTNRHPTGVSPITGTGMSVQAGFNS